MEAISAGAGDWPSGCLFLILHTWQRMAALRASCITWKSKEYFLDCLSLGDVTELKQKLLEM
jgi:hypothetical protein